jgi:polar amino acid transport system substrate-binding protein
MTIMSGVADDLAPRGRLRAAINIGNTILAQKEARTGELTGVAADLTRELAARLGVPLEFITYDTAGKVLEALKSEAWDVAFVASDPARAAEIEFTAPYVIIEGNYVVPASSELTEPSHVDRPGVRIAVVRASAYDLYLSRTIQSAELVRADTGEDSMDLLLKKEVEAVAGVKQILSAFMGRTSGLRMIEPRFMAIQQAMGTHKGRSAGAAYLRTFIEEMKAAGFVAESLKRSCQHGAIVAQPCGPSR